jgi:serine protease Do
MFTVRSLAAIPVLVFGLFGVATLLPAQFNLLSEPGASGSRIGVHLRDIDGDRASALKLGSVSGVEVVGVENGSPAEQAGIKPGDVLLSYNSESIIGAQQLGRLVSETPVGRKVKLELYREGKVSNVLITTAAAHQTMLFNMNSEPAGFGAERELLQPGSFPSPLFIWTTPRLGIECEGLNSHDSQLAEYFGVRRGVLVRSVVKDSPAAKAGMRAGDVVTQIGEHTVTDPKDITSYVRQELHDLKPVSIEVIREHKPLTMKVSLAPNEQE